MKTSEQQLATSYPGRNAENPSYREDRSDSIACLLLPVMFSGDITAAPCPYTHESAWKSLCRHCGHSWLAPTWGLCTSVLFREPSHIAECGGKGKTLCLQEGKAGGPGWNMCWKQAIKPAWAFPVGFVNSLLVWQDRAGLDEQSSESETSSDIKGPWLWPPKPCNCLSILDGHLRLGEREGTSSKGAD